MSEFKHDAELRDWVLADIAGTVVVFGKIYNDSKGRFSDGEEIRTSKVKALENGRLTTQNTKYLLVNV